MVPKVVQNKAFGEGTKRAKKTLSIFEKRMRKPVEFEEFCFSQTHAILAISRMCFWSEGEALPESALSTFATEQPPGSNS